jgi:hypothetical protein
MVKPISLRLRNAEILAQAHAALGRGRQQELRQAHNARVMERARGIVAQAREQDRLRHCAKLAAFKAIAAVREAYWTQDKVNASEFEQKRWHERRELVEAELMKIVKGARP